MKSTSRNTKPQRKSIHERATPAKTQKSVRMQGYPGPVEAVDQISQLLAKAMPASELEPVRYLIEVLRADVESMRDYRASRERRDVDASCLIEFGTTAISVRDLDASGDSVFNATQLGLCIAALTRCVIFAERHHNAVDHGNPLGMIHDALVGIEALASLQANVLRQTDSGASLHESRADIYLLEQGRE